MTLGRVLGLALGVLFDFDDHWRDRRSFESANVYDIIGAHSRARVDRKPSQGQMLTRRHVGKAAKLTGRNIFVTLPFVVVRGVSTRRPTLLKKEKKLNTGKSTQKFIGNFFWANFRGGGRHGWVEPTVSGPHAPAKQRCSGSLSACRYKPTAANTHAACLFQPRSRRQWMRHLASFFELLIVYFEARDAFRRDTDCFELQLRFPIRFLP